MNRDQSLTRDPVTGVPAHRAETKLGDKPSPDEIAEHIRGTRAHMTATLDEIEERLSPAHIADEVRNTVRETVEDVREQIHPGRMAKRAGDTMLETIRENPIPSLAAGLSIGYLIMKGAESDHGSRRQFERRGGYSGYERRTQEFGRGDRPWEYDYRFEQGSTGRMDEGETFGEHHESRAHRVAERAGELRHEMSERSDELQRKAAQGAREASHRAREMGRSARHGAKRAESSIEDFVHENPLIAGLITAGIGAMVGAALPSTRKENELMGHTRDEVVDRTRDLAREKGGQVKEAVRRVGEEARHHAEELGETAKEEARAMASTDGSTQRPESQSQQRPGNTFDDPSTRSF